MSFVKLKYKIKKSVVIKNTLEAKYRSKVIPAKAVKIKKNNGSFFEKNKIMDTPINPKVKIHLKIKDS